MSLFRHEPSAGIQSMMANLSFRTRSPAFGERREESAVHFSLWMLPPFRDLR